MPRSKKGDESKNKKKKEDIEEELAKDELYKEKKKSGSKSKLKTHKKFEEEEDELSEIDERELTDNEENEQATVPSPSTRVHKREAIDPNTPIGKLKPNEILSYLIKLGGDTLNPQLKYGSIDLLNQLTGRRRRYQMYGSKRNDNGFNRNHGGFNRNDGRFNPRYRDRDWSGPTYQSNQVPSSRGSKSNQEADLYDN